jgi:endonuclease/exonuclease/phosphatase family metal-dependent hydrolase
MTFKYPLIKTFSLFCISALVGSGCGEPTEPKPDEPVDSTVVVDCEPDSIGGTWQLLGPDGIVVNASGDSTITNMALGEYSVTWQPVTDWTTPDPLTQTLTAGETAEFFGQYIDSNPFDGLNLRGESTLEVMTWNLEHFAKEGNVTVEYVIQIVEGLDIDIIALQEIESLSYFNQVREGLPHWTGDRATSAYASLNLAFLYPLEGETQVSAVYEILTDYRSEFPRTPYVLEGTFKNTEFVVINNHYKCCGDGLIDDTDVRDEETRRRDASLLLDDYVRTNFPDKAVIIVGDLNDEISDLPAANVFQNFIDAPESYRFVDMEIAQRDDVLWSYPSWPSHLDHILITNELFAGFEASEALVQVVPLHNLIGGWASYNRSLSDHLPVLLRLSLP